MSKSTLAANSLILSLGSALCLAIIIYLLPINIALSAAMLAVVSTTLVLVLAAGFALYLYKKFGSNADKPSTPETVFVNETWIMKH